MKQIRKPELLAPCGSIESVYAAVCSGCDAIYLGGKDFSARSSAANFSIQEIEETVQYAHLRNVKVFVTVNTLFKNKEFDQVIAFISDLYKIGIDAIIVQDIGLLVIAKKLFPNMEVHASTQMTIHDDGGVKFLKSLGIDRVVISREVSLEEIKEIVNENEIPIESFVHGALCMSYSGQCLMSSFIGQRSGNRGKCAQPCRLPYSLYKENKEIITKGQYLLSLKDIETIEVLPELIEAGISSFKVEGRMKRPEYVAGVISIYKKYIDFYFELKSKYGENIELLFEKYKNKIQKNDIKILQQLFNRGGFSNGYYISQKDMMSTKSPRNIGLFIGKVVDYDKKNKKCKIKLEEHLNKGDYIEIHSNNDSVVIQIGESSKKESIITARVDEDVNIADKVYRTQDRELMDKLKQTYIKDTRKRLIYGHVCAKKGHPLTLKIWDNEGNVVENQGVIVEKSQNQPITQEFLKEQLFKTGNTACKFENIEVEIESDVYINMSAINEIRRLAIQQLEDIILGNLIKDRKHIGLKDIKTDNTQNKTITNKKLTVSIKSLKQIESCINKKVDKIYCEIESINIMEIEKYISLCHNANIQLFISLPYIYREKLMKRLSSIVKQLENTEIDGFLIRTYGQLQQFKDTNKKLSLDYNFNVMNNKSNEFLQSLNAETITLSTELNSSEIKSLGNANNEIIIYGYLPLMIMEQCIFGNEIGCKNENKKSDIYLRDRIRENFRIENNCNYCKDDYYTVLYNSKPIFLLNQFVSISKLPVGYMRLNFTNETDEDIKDIIQAHVEMIEEGKIKSDATDEIVNKINKIGYTKGHYYRGVE